ncbi:MAG: HD domain-containing protein [Planctomycetes bacterium]|nr:HD domain-containing protein [Planctomycetota bacterium]
MGTERRYISTLKPNESIDDIFLVRDKDLRTAANGSSYIMCTLVDRSGTLPTRMWQANEAIYKAIPVDGFMRVRGRTESYRGSLQFIIEALQPIATDKVDLADFMPATTHDVEAMWAELVEILREVRNPPLRRLVKKFMEDHVLVAAMKKSPAAVEMHQAYIGGLLEHTLHVTRLAVRVLEFYPQLNADLLLASAFLHDIGKTAELTRDLTFRYTDRGQLVGHITIAAVWVQQKADLIAEETGEPFPQKTIDLLQHIILSHHGIHEYGSPKLPAIPEAMALHFLDNLDAKMNMFERLITTDTDGDSNFTNYYRALDVRVYKHSNALDGDGPADLFAPSANGQG